MVIVVVRPRLWPDRDGWVDQHESLDQLGWPSGKEGSDVRAVRGGDHRSEFDARGTQDRHCVGDVVGRSVAGRRAIAPTGTARVEGDHTPPRRQVRDEGGRHPGVDEVPGGHDEHGRVAIAERLPGDLDSRHVSKAACVRCGQPKVHAFTPKLRDVRRSQGSEPVYRARCDLGDLVRDLRAATVGSRRKARCAGPNARLPRALSRSYGRIDRDPGRPPGGSWERLGEIVDLA